MLLSVLQVKCIFNFTYFVDGLMTKKINDDLVENIMGSVAYKANGLGCEDKYVFLASYYAGNDVGDEFGDGFGDEFEIKPLTVLIDIASWKYIETDNITTTYEDNHYRYVLYVFSDEVSMKVFDK